MTEPNGFWESGTAGSEEFDEDLMNACLVQFDTKANLDLLTDRAGMFGYSSDDQRFWRSDGADLINLAIIEIGVDAAKPAASAANNGRVFWATDTLTLYIVGGGVQYLVSDQNVVIDHVALADAHAQYQKEAEKNAANGYAGLDAGGLVIESDISADIARVSALHAEDHQSRHDRAGADEIDGDVIDIDYTPTNYVPDTTPAEVTDVNELTSHLKGIDTKLSSALPGKKAALESVGPNDTVLQNDDDFSFAALANTDYYVMAYLDITGGGGFKGNFSLPSGTISGIVKAFNEENSGSGSVVTEFEEFTTTFSLTAAGGATVVNHWILHAMISIAGTPGTIQFQFAQNVNNGTPITLNANSFMIIQG